MTRGRLRIAIVVLVLAGGAMSPAASTAGTSRASFTEIEQDVMCIACHEPLAVAQSPEAFSERAFIRALIAKGMTKQQIEKQLVVQYGPAILAKPPAHGFNLLIYVLPPVLLVIALTGLAITIPKWRRRSRAAEAEPLPSGPELDPEDARRLEEDLARHA
jgi:cytochrome c-type biogenesis protein CcmH